MAIFSGIRRDGAMRRVFRWIARIPWWVWLFLAANQMLNLVVIPGRIAWREEGVQEKSGNPSYTEVRSHFQQEVREQQYQLAAAAGLALVFLLGAYWKGSRRMDSVEQRCLRVACTLLVVGGPRQYPTTRPVHERPCPVRRGTVGSSYAQQGAEPAMRRVLLLIVVLSLAFAPAPFPKPESSKTDSSKEDLKAMQGEWAERFADSALMTIVGDRMVHTSDYSWKFTLNAKTTPKRIEALGVGPRLAGKTRLGVYRLEKDKLTICWRLNSVGKLDWPASLAPVQKDVWVQVFKRVKP